MNLNSTNILLIEDNKGDALLVKTFLKDAAFKYQFFHADTFFEGVDIIRNREIDIALLDLTLPDTTGFRTLNKFLDQINHIPVIVMTGVNNEIVGNQAIKAGAQDFLVKGQFDGKLLGRSIRYSLQRFKTQLKLEETARDLTINEKRINETQQLAGIGNWEMDLVSNEMQWTDEVFRIFGIPSQAFSPNLGDFIKPVASDDRITVEHFFELAAKEGKQQKVEYRIQLDNGLIKYMNVTAKIYYEEMTEKILLVGSIQDITERKMHEINIIEQNINKQSSKIKDEALSDLSFHIRTPLSSIVNLTYLIEHSGIATHQQEYINGLKTSVDDLSLMINNLLNFSMLISENMRLEEEEINIADFFNSMKKILQIKSDNSKLAIILSVSKELPTKVIVDQKKLTQVVYNILDNAIKFSKNNSKIEIKIDGIEQEDKYNLIVRVEDAGIGMSKHKLIELENAEKTLNKIRDEESMIKTPMGIAIASKLVNVLGGHIHVASTEYVGTVVTINLPAKPIINTNYTTEVPSRPINILMVEDHFLNQIATKKVLTTWSPFVSVEIAENGLIGVEKFRANNYDIVLMDMQMPIMNGMDASLRIREISDVPIFALTANASKSEADKCFEIGINDYISKPFKPIELYQKIMAAVFK